MNSSSNQTPRDLALGSVPSEWREALLKRAADAGITRSDDVAWVLVSAVVDAIAAAAAAGDAASTTARLCKTLPEVMQKGANTAGAVLHRQVLDAGETIEQQLTDIAADTGKVIASVQERGIRQALGTIQGAVIDEMRAFSDEVVVSRTVGAEALQLAGVLLVAAIATWVGLSIGKDYLATADDGGGYIRAILQLPVGLVIGPVAGWGTYRLMSGLHWAIQVLASAFMLVMALLITFTVF